MTHTGDFMRKRFKAKDHTLYETTSEIFEFRRKIINLIYEAKKVIGFPLPRVDVRVVEYDKRSVLGRSHGNLFITISYNKHKDEPLNYLRATVWHELCHAWFNAEHVLSCPLMAPIASLNTPTKKKLETALKKVANKKMSIPQERRSFKEARL